MISVREKFNGRKRTAGNKPAMSIDYIIQRDAEDADTIDDSDLIEALSDFAPGSLYDEISGLDITSTAYLITEQLDETLWIGQTQYGSDQVNQKDGQYSYTFETSGGTQKILQSIAQRGYPQTRDGFVHDALAAPDLKGAIGVTDDRVEGVDITVPIFQWSETWTLKTLTPQYQNAVYALTGTTNAASFRDLPADECLFLGASGSKRGRGDWEITFKFAASPSRSNFTIAGLTIDHKKGWEYLWVDYEKQIVGSGAGMKVRMVPKFVYIEQVYFQGDYNALGIGN